MTIWALADIHASPLSADGRPEKPMDVFGDEWRDHVERVEAAWRRNVSPHDTVLLAGDLDWSMYLQDAVPTLERMGSWPGKKLLVRGNHDYWWSSKATSKVRRILPDSMSLLHNDSVVVEGFAVCGAKGAPLPGAPEWTETDGKLLNRELERLKISLGAREAGLPVIVMMHYPPAYIRATENTVSESPFVSVMKANEVVACVYGHLHGESAALGPNELIDGIRYQLVAADFVGFQPIDVSSGLIRDAHQTG
jgi:predicted phosphohydrolase